ncbi:MAG: nucleotidyl transferase AbiEii/AbiGii toxin family protein [Blastocatellia bacterium]
MFDLYEEFKSIISALDEEKIDYALCGGLAMAVHGLPRATIDIDLLVLAERLDEAKSVVRSLGYTIEALPMSFSKGAIEIRRLSKIDPTDGDLLMVDFLVVTPAIADAWNNRIRVASKKSTVSVVSPEGLIALKSFRRSAQDIADIERLKGRPR